MDILYSEEYQGSAQGNRDSVDQEGQIQVVVEKDSRNGRQGEWKMNFVHWNRGSVRQTLEKKIDFDINPSFISVPVTEVDINCDGYMDFIIDYGILGKVRKGECIIWNTETLKYEFLEGYSELCNAVFDTRTGRPPRPPVAAC